jgi:hypothetical protein
MQAPTKYELVVNLKTAKRLASNQLPTPMPFTTGSFRACASASRTANNGVHQLSLLARKIM